MMSWSCERCGGSFEECQCGLVIMSLAEAIMLAWQQLEKDLWYGYGRP
jgi:hypothetical protein